jgi:hypothetical protein
MVVSVLDGRHMEQLTDRLRHMPKIRAFRMSPTGD